VLDRAHRLRSGPQFTSTIRRGRRAGTRTLVLHWACSPEDPPVQPPPQVGLVVSKAVGNAVARNQVKRRLRHLARARVDVLPDGCVLVIRALPPAASASSADLGADLDRALQRVVGKDRAG